MPDFDPYHRWLGITPDEQPPTPHRLLGIAPDETDKETIRRAALQRNAFIRQFSIGEQGKIAERLLNEIAAARDVILAGIMQPAVETPSPVETPFEPDEEKTDPALAPTAQAPNSIPQEPVIPAIHIAVENSQTQRQQSSAWYKSRWPVVLAASSMLVLLLIVLWRADKSPDQLVIMEDEASSISEDISKTGSLNDQASDGGKENETNSLGRSGRNYMLIPEFTYAISDDCQIVAVATDDNVIKLLTTDFNQELGTLEGHSGVINAIAFSSEGKQIVSCADDNMVKVWNTEQQTELFSFNYVNAIPLELDKDTWNPRLLDLNSDSQLLLLASRNLITLWSLRTGEFLKAFPHTRGTITRAEFDSKSRIVCAQTTSGVAVYEIESGNRIVVPEEAHTKGVRCFALSSNGEMLATGSDDQTIRLWNTINGEEKAVFDKHGSGITALDFNVQGTLLISGDKEGVIRLWNIANSEEISLFTHSDETYSRRPERAVDKATIHNLSFINSGRVFSSTNYQGAYKLWEIGTDQAIKTIESSFLTGGRYFQSPDASRVVSIGNDFSSFLEKRSMGVGRLPESRHDFSGTSRILQSWNPIEYPHLITPIILSATKFTDIGTTRRTYFDSMTFSPDGELLAFRGLGNAITIRNIETGIQDSFHVHEAPVTKIAFDPQVSLIASLAENGNLKIWSPNTGEELITPLRIPPELKRFVFGFDNAQRLIMAFTKENDKAIVSARAFRDGRSLGTSEELFQCDSFLGQSQLQRNFSVNNRFLIGERDQSTFVWDLSRDESILTVKNNLPRTINSEGSIFAGVVEDEGKWVINLWDVKSKALILEIDNIERPPGRIEFSPNNEWLAVLFHGGPQGSQLVLFNVKNGQEQIIIRDSWEIVDFAFSPNGHVIATGGMSLQLWSIKSGQEITTLRGVRYHGGPGNYHVGKILFSPTGDFLVTQSHYREEYYQKLWDLREVLQIAR